MTMSTTLITHRRYPTIRIVDVAAAHTRNRRARTVAATGKARPDSSMLGRRKVVSANIVRLIPGQTRLPFEAGSF
jgi:hypothetical protein